MRWTMSPHHGLLVCWGLSYHRRPACWDGQLRRDARGELSRIIYYDSADTCNAMVAPRLMCVSCTAHSARSDGKNAIRPICRRSGPAPWF